MKAAVVLLALGAAAAHACSFDDCREGGLELRPSFKITVRHDGAGLSGVRVTVSRIGELRHLLDGETDAKGRFQVNGLAPGRYQLSAGKLDQYAALHCFRVLENPSGDAQSKREYKWPDREDLVRRAAGRLIDRGTPIAGASVRLLHPRDAAATRTTRTDEQGQFQFVGVTPGTYVLEIEGGTGGRAYDPSHVPIRVSGLPSSTPDSLYFSPTPAICRGASLELVAYPAPPEQQ